jgi:hypothetical protein
MNLRQHFHRYVPAHFHDPFGLALRLVRSGDPAALFAMAAAAGGVAATPADLALAPFERRLTMSANSSRHPLILICGAPRSGTTVVYQTLVNHLPVAYFSNLTALFPRSPLAAQRLLGRFVAKPRAGYRSFYGRTEGLAGTNDALFLWDRWLGGDRTSAPDHIDEARKHQMRQFFAACDRQFDRPLLNKNNSLNLSAHLVAECLPQAHFICMTRNPRQLAQSLYRARCDIHGAPGASYGIAAPSTPDGGDPIRSVCAQAAYYDEVNERQRLRLGDEQFWLTSYEEFCRAPGELVRRVAREVLGAESLVEGALPDSFATSSADRVPSDVAAQIDATLAAAGAPLAACG